MQDFRKVFFQVLLVILVLAFTLGIRYAVSTESTKAGNFGQNGKEENITVSEVFGRIYSGEGK